MPSLIEGTLALFRKEQPEFEQMHELPEWLESSRWHPSAVFRDPHTARYVCVDVIPSAGLPPWIFQQAASLLTSMPNVVGIVCAMEQEIEARPSIIEYCKAQGFGLKAFGRRPGLVTIVQSIIDGAPDGGILLPVSGLFPQPILDRAKEVKRLFFADKVVELVQRIESLGDDEQAVLSVVSESMDSLLQSHPSFTPDTKDFMKLKRFEELFRHKKPEATDHVVHSMRVFLAGCPIIDAFYAHFSKAHNRSRGMLPEAETRVEYSWLISALFHDACRWKEGTVRSACEEIDGVEFCIAKDYWVKEERQRALQILASYAAFVARNDGSAWDGGSFLDADGVRIRNDWVHLYNTTLQHGIVSALDFFSTVVWQMMGADEAAKRPFVLAHTVPAAMAILLHDWRTRDKQKEWSLYPIDQDADPLSALLVYIDTWDDYRRKPGPSPIDIEDYIVDQNGVTVRVRWESAEDHRKELIKYSECDKALSCRQFNMRIDHAVGNRGV